MSLVSGIDLSEVWKHDAENRENAVAEFEKIGLWRHFESLNLFYADLYHGVDKDIFKKPEILARFQHFTGCWINLSKGMSSLLAGHLTDSSVFARRSLESVRFSVFLRQHPELANLWFETYNAERQVEFEKLYNRWFRDKGRIECENEYDKMTFGFKLASNFGAHSNLNLFLFQQKMLRQGDGTVFQFHLHEIEPSEEGYYTLMNHYLWFLGVHFQVAAWWTDHGKTHEPLIGNRKKFWHQCWKDFADQADALLPLIRAKMPPGPQPLSPNADPK